MLAPQQCFHSLFHSSTINSTPTKPTNFIFSSSFICKPSRPNKLSISSSSIAQTHHNNDDRTSHSEDQEPLLRKHNARSTALLLRRLSQQAHQESMPQETQRRDEDEESEKLRVLELSLVRRRAPQFPGSIYLQSLDEKREGSSSSALGRLFPGGEADFDNDVMLKRALEIRRNVTAEIFMEAMRGGKFGITYSTNLVSALPDFIDHVMIEAAAMKGRPEFSHFTFNARAKTFIRNSNVIPLIRWLKHNSLTYPQIGKIICMSCGNLGVIRSSIEWLKKIYVKGEFLGIVMVKAGQGVLGRSIEELEEIIAYIESNGVRREWMGFVVSRCPLILSYSMEELRSRIEFYMDMGMNEKDFGTMVFEYPKALGAFTMEEMKSKVNYLKEFGLGDEDLGRLIAFKPHLIGCSIETKWKPLVKYLYYFGVNRDGMRRMLTLKPMVFCLDLETTIAPKVRFLQDIGIRKDAIGNMLVRFPPLLTYSLYKKIRPVVIFLMTKAGVSQRDIGKVIALGPELVGCNITHKLDINVKYFLSLGIHLRLLGQMIADFPMLLRYNIDVLRPKYRYLRRTMVRPLKDLIEFPRYFSYSLEGRIIPRHKVLVKNRINFKLRYMLGSTDEEFHQRVAVAVERRRKFESGNVNDSFADSRFSHHSTETTLVDDGRLENTQTLESLSPQTM